MIIYRNTPYRMLIYLHLQWPIRINMVSKISAGIEITVEVFYQSDYSNPLKGEFMFAYRITIENHNKFAVQLFLIAMQNTEK